MNTALVTGASTGLGAEFARQLAVAGYRLVLVARDGERLAAARPSLQQAGSPDIEVLPADLTDHAQLATVVARLGDPARPVDLLVNNAGAALGRDFLQADEDQLRNQLELNVMAVTMLARAALPGMVRRGHGGVINVASIAGLIPGRGTSYAASKAFVISLSEGLSAAVAGTGVRVQALCPGFIRTEFHQRAGIDMSRAPGRSYTDIDLVVRTSLEDLRSGRPLSVPGNLYRALAVGVRLLPRSVVRSLASRVNNKGRT